MISMPVSTATASRGSATAIDKAKDSETKHPFTSDANDKLEGGFMDQTPRSWQVNS